MNIVRSLTNQTPTPNQIERLESMRALAIDYGKYLNDLLPAGRAQALALTNLEQSVMWAAKAIVQADQ